VIVPRWKVGVTRPSAKIDVPTDEPGLFERRQANLDVPGANGWLVPEDQDAKLLGFGHEPAVIVGFAEQADP
jgi:hypothetical protein